MFRAAPWISYEPSVAVDTVRHQIQLPEPIVSNDMDEDIDMDAPQISTLRDEETPPPIRTSKFRVKLLVNDNKGAPSAPRKQGEDEDVDEDEDEEDQLIDDDDNNNLNSNPTTRPLDVPGKRKPSHKRKPRKSEKRMAEDERQAREKEDVHPGVSHMDRESPPRDTYPIHNDTPEPLPKAASQKKVAAKKPSAAPRSRPSRAKAVPKALKDVVLPHVVDDPGTLSETYTATAASSPIPCHHDAGSPEPDNIGHHMFAPFTEETNLDSIPLPVYPLPSKPFPVQPPPKVGAGFAPAISLDKSGAKVRHWRVANREIRGIGGGRWFAHAWVGDKESDFASSSAAASKTAGEDKVSASGVALPKLSSVPISAPSGKGSKAKLAKAAASASATTSRSGSVIPDPHIARALAPTKMRTIIAAPPSEADSDMTTAA